MVACTTAVCPGVTVPAAGTVAVTPSVYRAVAVTIGPVAVPEVPPASAVTGEPEVAVQPALVPAATLTGTATVTAPCAGTVTPEHFTPAVVVQVPPPVVVTVPSVYPAGGAGRVTVVEPASATP